MVINLCMYVQIVVTGRNLLSNKLAKYPIYIVACMYVHTYTLTGTSPDYLEFVTTYMYIDKAIPLAW